tara:strand:+ start:359 stop:520 length:162 start_codon:yes stop_codon:yes gene_type:complete
MKFLSVVEKKKKVEKKKIENKLVVSVLSLFVFLSFLSYLFNYKTVEKDKNKNK